MHINLTFVQKFYLISILTKITLSKNASFPDSYSLKDGGQCLIVVEKEMHLMFTVKMQRYSRAVKVSAPSRQLALNWAGQL